MPPSYIKPVGLAKSPRALRARMTQNPPPTLASSRRHPPIHWELNESTKVRTPALTHAPTGTHALTRTSRPPLAQTATLKVRRLCALPSCATDGGQHNVSRCSDPRCPATALAGGEHCALLAACNGAAERRSQAKLWKESSAHNPAEWWSFPASATLLEGITLPPELSDYTLNGLDLHVRTTCLHARAPASLALASPALPHQTRSRRNPQSPLKPRWQVCHVRACVCVGG